MSAATAIGGVFIRASVGKTGSSGVKTWPHHATEEDWWTWN